MVHAVGENISSGYAPIFELVVDLFPWLLVIIDKLQPPTAYTHHYLG